MANKIVPYLFEVIVVALAAGCCIHPAAAALGLLIILGHRIADKYFTRNITDADRETIAQIKTDCDKIKKVQDRAGLSKAFTP